MTVDSCLLPGAAGVPELGVPLLDRYLVFVAARARPNTVLATAENLGRFTLKVSRV